MSSRKSISRAIACCAVLPLLGFSTATSSTAAGSTLDVATTGKDTNAGTATAPLKTIQKAIDLAKPGTTIRIHKGTYSQQLIIRTSGTAAAPITMTSAGDGEVKITSTQPAEDCDSRVPTPRRTLLVQKGSDYWTFSKLWIDNGVYINGGGASVAYNWHAGLVKKQIWEPRRAVPGAAKNEPTVAKTQQIPYMEKVLKKGLNPAEHIELTDNKITGRGIHAMFSWYGVLKNNTITDIQCGTGPGVWIIGFSNFWEVTGNDVSKIATSGDTHFMEEGIRLGTASNYNHIASNTVHDLVDDGRGIATDVDASFNIFENNTVTNVPIAYNDEMSGWGNIWRNNKAIKYTILGFGFRLKDRVYSTPSMNSSTNMAIVSGNVASDGRRGAAALSIGAIKASKFENNVFPIVKLGKFVPGYWAKQGNTWNGSTKPPVSK